MIRIYIALGSNQGNRTKNLENAILFLHKHGIAIINKSSVYETEAWGSATGQAPYLNQVLEGDTNLSPEDLLALTQQCEQSLGRTSEQGHMQPRLIDIDILYYGQVCIDLDQLKIPHPFLHERMFVLLPLLEIAEDWVDPRFEKAVWELYDSCRDTCEVAIFTDQ